MHFIYSQNISVLQGRENMMSVMSIDSVVDRVDSVASGDLSQHDCKHDRPGGAGNLAVG